MGIHVDQEKHDREKREGGRVPLFPTPRGLSSTGA